MAWYRTGTVAVTAGDTVITGTGTLFATHARVGDGFVGPDGRMYEVTNIASETVLAIFPTYQGATAAGQEYGIIPVQGYPKQLADRAGAMVDQVGELPTRIDDIDAVLAALGSAAGADLADLLTKAGNLAGLADKAQSQFNLGVILSLAGQVFNTDNCTIAMAATGFTIRFANGLQVSTAYRNYVSGDMGWSGTSFGKQLLIPAATPPYWLTPFKEPPVLVSVMLRDSNVDSFVAAVPIDQSATSVGNGLWLSSPNAVIPPSGSGSLRITALGVGVYQ